MEIAAKKYLKDYRPSAFAIDRVSLDFDLQLAETRVRAKLQISRLADHAPLVLDGESLILLEASIDGRRLSENEYQLSATSMTLPETPAKFELETLVEINPSANSVLMGLYVSGGRFCTQCESEGFRRITYFLDRPDVLTRYTVRLAADRSAYPTLLSNGDCIDSGPLEGGRHYAVWHDPYPKPAYLFALVAGSFESIHDNFQTMSGKSVALSIHADPGCSGRVTFAMDALKRAMRWDEQVFKLEYDLSQFHIVAVRDFNYGAMENKSLNIFNASAILADMATETDEDFAHVERVVAHEYFHNWTGNRITLRNWFQLCLKEGLTVFRDQEFTADQHSRAVQRIKDVDYLRANQLPEDTGPLAHPVRPEEFVKIDNFYTATIYRKGAEVIRVLSALLGGPAFAAGLQHYFSKFDGQAVTVEDFVGCFEHASGRDLGDFLRWYRQAGTPIVTVDHRYDAGAQTLTLTVLQDTPPTPGQLDKQALPIPLRVGFIDEDGVPLTARYAGVAAEEHAIVLDQARATWVFDGVGRRPVPAVLRGAPAPVVLNDGLNDADRLIQMRHDPDSFTRWDAGKRVMSRFLLGEARKQDNAPLELDEVIRAIGSELARADADPALTARLVAMPTLNDLIQLSAQPDLDALDDRLSGARAAVARALEEPLTAAALHPAANDASRAPYHIGRRALKTVALGLLAAQGERHQELVSRSFADAQVMTVQLAALNALGTIGGEPFRRALAAFENQWRDEPLVMDKWFAVQARKASGDAAGQIRELTRHRLFSIRTPNRARAVYVTFGSQNLRHFHAPDGSGYRLLGEAITEADSFNPLLASRFLRSFDTWTKFDDARKAAISAVLSGLRETPLSDIQSELVQKLLAQKP